MQKPTPPVANGEQLPHEEDPASDSNFVTDASTQVPPQMHTNGGGMPPQQVYVETTGPPAPGMPNDVSGLETQFQSLGIQQQQPGAGGVDNAGHGEGDDDIEDLEDEGGEDDPLKLFVGQVRHGIGYSNLIGYRVHE